MNKLALLSLLPTLLTAEANAQPAPIFAIPITGQLANGKAAAGQATGYDSGLGEFWVAFPGSIRCTGCGRCATPTRRS